MYGKIFYLERGGAVSNPLDCPEVAPHLLCHKYQICVRTNVCVYSFFFFLFFNTLIFDCVIEKAIGRSDNVERVVLLSAAFPCYIYFGTASESDENVV